MVRYLTTNGKSDSYGASHPFALRYRRAKGTFYEVIKLDALARVVKADGTAKSFRCKAHES
jgi:hypothetical protein